VIPRTFIFTARKVIALDVLSKACSETTFRDSRRPFASILDLTRTFENVTLEKVLLEWMDRLSTCIRTNDDSAGGDEERVKGWEYFIR
jgi:hypothetical protein